MANNDNSVLGNSPPSPYHKIDQAIPLSDTSRKALSGQFVDTVSGRLSDESLALSQERLAIEGAAAKQRVDHQIAEYAIPGTYKDSYVSQGLSGVNEGIANVLGGPVDIVEMGLNGLSWGAEKTASIFGVEEGWAPDFDESLLGSKHIKSVMRDYGAISPESADPNKRLTRDGVEITTDVGSALIGVGVARASTRLAQQTDETTDVLRHGEQVTHQQLGNRADDVVRWVDENASMNAAAKAYDDGAIGSRSNIKTRAGQAPSIERTMPSGEVRTVRFDGLEDNILIDRKRAVVTTQKAKDQVLRQSKALEQNGLTARWEVPTQAQAVRAQKLFDELGIDNITVKVVPE